MPIRPSSPAELSNALTGIDAQATQKGNAFFDDMLGIAQYMNQVSELHSKVGDSSSIGTDKLAKRIDLLPYVATEGKDPDTMSKEMKLLLTEPDDNAALSGIKFGNAKADRQIVVSKEISSALKKAGYDVPEGTVVKQREYNNMLNAAKLGFSAEREGRLSKTVNTDLMIKELNYQLKKLKLTKEQSDALINAAVEAAMKKQSATEKPTD